MAITKLKAKNQVTIPSAIVKRLHLRLDELFSVGVEKGDGSQIRKKVKLGITLDKRR